MGESGDVGGVGYDAAAARCVRLWLLPFSSR